jgi:predicted nucleic acid-binding protein
LSYPLSTAFQNIESLLFKVSVEEKVYQPLIIYGQIILKKNLDLEIEEWKTPQKKIMLLHFIQIKEEDSKETPDKHSKMKSLHQTHVIIREEMFHKFSDYNMGLM